MPFIEGLQQSIPVTAIAQTGSTAPATSSTYATIPGRVNRLTVICTNVISPSAMTTALIGSHDGTNYADLTSTTGTTGFIMSVETTVPFVRVRINSAATTGSTVTMTLSAAPV